MFPVRMFSLLLLLALALSADGQNQPIARDLHGDPLPPGAVARLGTVRFRHNASIVFAAFLPGGRTVLSASEDGVLCAWEFPSGKEVRRFDALPGSGVRLTGATLSPDGKYLTAFCDDNFLRILDWASSKELGKVAHGGGETRDARVSSISSLLGRTVRRTTATSLNPVYSPDGKTLLLPGSPRVLQLVDLPGGKEIGPNPGHTEPLTAIGFTLDREKIWAKDSKATHHWLAATGKELDSRTIRMPSNLGSPTIISPDGRVGVTVATFRSSAVARAATVRDAFLFDTATGKQLGKIALEVEVAPAHRRPIVFSPDGKILAVNMGDTREKITLYQVPSGKVLRTLDAGTSATEGKRPFGGVIGGPGGGPVGFRGSATQNMFFSPDGQALAFQASPQSALVILDTVSGKQIATLPVTETSSATQGVFSPDGRCLALERTDGKVALYELATGQVRATYGNAQPGRAASNRDDDDTLPAFLRSQLLASTKPRATIAISPDGKLLALSGESSSIQVWDVLSATELTVFKGHTLPVNAVAFSPSGKTLASASDDTTALLWDVTRITRKPHPVQALQPADLDTWWRALADSDASKAFTAIGAFTAAPRETVTWIRERIKAVAPLDMKRVAELIRQLDDQSFRVRDRATAELLKMGEGLLPVFEKTLGSNPSQETRQRLEELRSKMTSTVLQGEKLRSLRAVEVLERIGTPEARQVLQTLAAGAPGVLMTSSAQAALLRQSR